MVKVFGSVDRRKDGKIASEYPAWYFDQQKEELQKTIREDERRLENDAIPPSAKPRFRESLARKKERFAKIEQETPKLKGPEVDMIKTMRNDIGKRISEARPKRSEIERGLVDGHEEARRMSEPCVELKGEQEAEFAKECEINITDGKITRNDLERMHKLMSKMVGESTDIEYLRRP